MSRKKKYKEPFLKLHPYLEQEIDHEQNKNNGIEIDKISAGSNKFLNWICPNFKHKFRAKVKDRTLKNSNCPRCKNSDTNLAKVHPELLKEWDYEKNIRNPNIVSIGSPYYAWWICTYCSKNWQATVNNRVNAKSKSGCKSCAVKRSKTKNNNNLAHLFPSIAAEWHPEQNTNLKSSEVAPNSNLKIKWACLKCNYIWEAKIQSRTNGRGCPKCAGKVISNESSFGGRHPDLIKYWDFINNIHLSPYQVTPQSKKKVFFNCPKDSKHRWEATVQSISIGGGCPYCSGRRVLKKDSFGAKCERGLELWSWDKNKKLDPYKISTQSNKKVWWDCNRGHKSWQTTVQAIFNGGGCKLCNSNKSILEKFIINKLINNDEEIIAPYQINNQDACNIYLPKLNVIIEFNLEHHANFVKEHEEKGHRIMSAGFTFVRIYYHKLKLGYCNESLAFNWREESEQQVYTNLLNILAKYKN